MSGFPCRLPTCAAQAAAQALLMEQVQLMFGRVLLTWLWHLVSLQLPDLQEAAKAGRQSRHSRDGMRCMQTCLQHHMPVCCPASCCVAPHACLLLCVRQAPHTLHTMLCMDPCLQIPLPLRRLLRWRAASSSCSRRWSGSATRVATKSGLAW